MEKSLKELLGDDLHKQVVEKTPKLELIIVEKGQKAFIHKDGETPVISNNGEWIPRTKYEAKRDQVKVLQEETDTYKIEIGKLKKLAGDESGELKTKITELETKIESNITENERRTLESSKRETDITKKYAVKDALRDLKVKHPSLLLKEIDLEKIELDSDGKIKHFDDHVKPLKESYPDLFGKVKLDGKEPIKPGTLPEGHITKEQFDNMSEAERITNADKINESVTHWNK